MANKDVGFFAQLTGSDLDERAIASAQIQQGIEAGGPMASMFHALGQQLGAGAGVIGAGLVGGARRGQGGTFGSRFADAAQRADDNIVSQMVGITPGELRARRTIRKEIAKLPNDGTAASRIKMAERAVEVAQRLGDPASLSRAIGALQAARNEELEFAKLDAEIDSKKIKNTSDSVVTGYTSDGQPLSGVLQRNKEGVAGLLTSNGFKPFDETFSLADPDKGGLGSNPMAGIHSRLRDATTPSYLNQLRQTAAGAMSTLKKTERVMSTLTDMYNKGGVGAVIGESGKALKAVDNFLKNVRGFVSAWATAGESADNRSYRDELIAEAQSGTSRFLDLIQLPEGVQRASAAAQQHQAAVMEMAYMAARLAEPSNRGLSDNDIKNALVRIAGDTSNPAVMARRFIEMQADAAAELDFSLGFFKGNALGEDVTDEMIDRAILGKSYAEYTKARDELYKKYQVRVSPEGRAVFYGDTMGTDVQPGEGISPETKQQHTLQTDDVSLVDFESMLFGEE